MRFSFLHPQRFSRQYKSVCIFVYQHLLSVLILKWEKAHFPQISLINSSSGSQRVLLCTIKLQHSKQKHRRTSEFATAFHNLLVAYSTPGSSGGDSCSLQPRSKVWFRTAVCAGYGTVFGVVQSFSLLFNDCKLRSR